MIAGHDEHRNAAVGDASERFERLVSDGWHHQRSIEHVAAVHDEVDLAGECWLQRGRVVREEVETATAAFDPRSRREIEAEVRIGEQQNA